MSSQKVIQLTIECKRNGMHLKQYMSMRYHSAFAYFAFLA